MKFHWGHGIAIFYGIFALSMIALVFRSTYYDHTLVTEKYYEEDLQYQQQYEKLANSQEVGKSLKVWKNPNTGSISIQFPEGLEAIQGKVTFYRPVNSKEDFSIPFQLSEQSILEYDTKSLRSGPWTLKIDWQAGAVPYYQELNIII